MAWITDAVNWVTDASGLTDSKSGQRANDAMVAGMENANSQLQAGLQQSRDQLGEAALGRSLGENLGRYDDAMGTAMSKTDTAGNLAMSQAGAGNSNNVQDYLNPQMEQMLSKTMQTMQGGAGAALQSSATNKEISNAVASKAGDLWQSAFNNAMSDASNNLNVAKTYGQAASQNASLAGQQLTADNAPAEDLLSLNNDAAMQQYAANTGMTQANMQLAGQKNTIL